MLNDLRSQLGWNVTRVCDAGLCTGCGTCAGMCPWAAIEMRRTIEGFYLPAIDDRKCVRTCELCSFVCPGVFLDFERLNKQLFGMQPTNWLIGNAITCYVGHCAEDQMRRNASSGGIVPAILGHILQADLIDYAIVTRLSEKNPLEPEVFVARNMDDILQASGSKYCPVNQEAAIKHILTHPGRYALVGLPCHVEGIRKAQMKSPKLRERLVFIVGLFCDHTVSFRATELLLRRMRIDKLQVVKVSYRSQGWPGGFAVSLANGHKKFLPRSTYWGCFFRHFFLNRRCTLCPDQTNELADVSVGDAWLQALQGRDKGESVIVTRTELGERAVRDAVRAGRIAAFQVSEATIVESQRSALNSKKRSLIARMRLTKWFGAEVPEFDSELGKPRSIAYLNALLTYVTMMLSRQAWFVRLLENAPVRVLSLYDKIIYVMNNG